MNRYLFDKINALAGEVDALKGGELPHTDIEVENLETGYLIRYTGLKDQLTKVHAALDEVNRAGLSPLWTPTEGDLLRTSKALGAIRELTFHYLLSRLPGALFDEIHEVREANEMESQVLWEDAAIRIKFTS